VAAVGAGACAGQHHRSAQVCASSARGDVVHRILSCPSAARK
jgi:hypothetical protein